MGEVDFFAKLPPEVLTEIFSYELLVPYRKIPPGEREVKWSQGITIIDGKAEYPYPTALFYVDRKSSWLARTYTYLHNRFILGGKAKLSVAWLASRPSELAALIHRLDLLLLPHQLHDADALAGFDPLLAAVQQNLELGKLHLSLDASRCYLSLHDEESNQDWLKPIYRTLLRIFRTRDDLSKLADFFVFYPSWASEESTLEKAVKGQDYDAVARGKTKLAWRDHRLVHGWEYGWFRADFSWESSSDVDEYNVGDGMISDSYVECIKMLDEEMAAKKTGRNRISESP